MSARATAREGQSLAVALALSKVEQKLANSGKVRYLTDENYALFPGSHSDKEIHAMSADTQTTTTQAPALPQMQGAIVVDGFSKIYGSQRVVDHLSFSVQQGEIFALLGPNGAGKTTTVETLEGYRAPDEGRVRVLECDPIREGNALKAQIGVMLQQDGLYPALTAREVLRLFAGYFARSQPIDELLERVGLSAAAKTRCRRLSGGQKRRLALAVALVGNPALVFMDEPTAGMDPQARLTTWEIIRDLKSRGVTILLTTHLMDEAERLADRVAIIDHGRLLALDTPAQLTGTQTANVVRFVAPAGLDCAQLAALPSARKAEEIRPGSYLIESDQIPALLAELTAWLRDQHITLSELRVGNGSLEDLFLRLTGTEVRD
jgi:ABC-2 type transport system ATP-binding protein